MIFENIKKSTLLESDVQKYMDWCIKITSNEINRIVSNQYRGQYDKATEELIAYAEIIANVRGEAEKYKSLMR